MFAHFVLAVLFIGFMILAYTKSVVKEPFWPYVLLMISIGMIWIGLYFFARYNRLRGLKQAKELEKVYEEWIKP
jgi:glucan phosphoethanolaminetransferase (alkaline phosphatase superfamily)